MGSEHYAIAYTDLSIEVLSAGHQAVIASLKNRLLASEFDWNTIAARSHRISLGEIPGREYLRIQNG
jgi:hypothetical protein